MPKLWAWKMINVTSSQAKLRSAKFEGILYLADPHLYKI